MNFSALIKQEPDNALAYYQRGSERNDVSAVEDLTEAIALNPDFADAYEERAHLLRKLGDATSAMRDLSKMIELDPKGVSAYQARADIYIDQKNWDDALADLTAVIDLQPPDMAMHEARAKAHRSAGENDLAIDDYRQVIELSQSTLQPISRLPGCTMSRVTARRLPLLSNRRSGSRLRRTRSGTSARKKIIRG